jgi:hypothetical protein
MNTSENTAILILSCDKYSDAWNPFFLLMQKYWPDCKFDVFLGTNEKGFDFPGIKVLKSGKARDWSADTSAILEQIPHENVIILLEDYFIMKPVDEVWLNKCISFLSEKNASFMRIASFRKDHFPMYAYDPIIENPEFGITRNEAPYKVNLQAGIWNKKDLIDLIKKGESPWEFEVNASKRCNASEKLFLCITESSVANILIGPIPYLCTAITRGTWMREAIELCRKEKIKLDLSIRPVESRFALARRKMYHSMPFWSRKYFDFISGKIS